MSRYENQERFEGFNGKTSDLKKKTVMIIGVGGLGSTIADMLNREGVPLRIVDKGRVLEADLQRQSAFLQEDDTKFKAKQIKKRLETVSEKNNVKIFHEDLVKENMFLINSADIVMDCSNDSETMKLIADHVKKKQHLINCKYAGSEGAIFISDKKHLYKKILNKIKVGDIKNKGVINATVHLAAGIMVAQVLKILVGEKITDNLIIFNVWKDQIRRVGI